MKTNDNFFISCLLVILISLIGCKQEWLDIKADKALVVPSTLSDFQGLLDNTPMFQLYPSLGEDAADEHYVTDATYQSVPISGLYFRDAYTWSKTSSHLKVSDWNDTYTKILIDNVVIDGLNKMKPSPIELQQWNDIKGQALFHRARSFFELAQTYAPTFDASTAEQDLGIVLRLSSDITILSKRSTVKATYDQILKDLQEAKNLLPIRPKILIRGSASAADALLARVYLSMRDYNNAFIAADNCLKQYSALLDYNDISPAANFMGLYNKEVLLHSDFIPKLLFGYSPALINQSFFDSYVNNDLRKTRFYRINGDGSKSFKGAYESTTVQLFNGLATDEIYLSRAECYARAGQTVEAMKDLNDLMVKRWDKNVVYPTITANSPDEALIKILEERKKELVFRGIRWMDLRRLNKDPRFAVTLKRTVLGVEYTLEPNSYKYTFPIPDDVIDQTGIQQNPGWR